MGATEEISKNAGPHGLGDPNDTSLRKVEIEVMIPKKMRDIAKVEKCTKEVEEFTKCCRDSNILMAFTCRDQNSALKSCLGKWYNNEEFKERCKKEYLAERSEYRRTGVTLKQKQKLQTSGF
ncbi:PREDICTED: COX assembly mitochondrial protein homolog [Nicrophorus vespilloides]|uniref:COX assembly mitochondrial protein n=1 Tax=Nicrophorus vespilloides TaxID=110193 RepID=A0ABM1LZV8_NICVS|nr:PREDICTED: COX assembly mitochondrial protein homolog [Nicrophorus vespilloides]